MFRCQTFEGFVKMAVSMDIRDFFQEIDPDLLKYASAFCKHWISEWQFALCFDMLSWKQVDVTCNCLAILLSVFVCSWTLNSKPSTYFTYWKHSRHLQHFISQILRQRNAWFEVVPIFVNQKHINNFEHFQTLARNARGNSMPSTGE